MSFPYIFEFRYNIVIYLNIFKHKKKGRTSALLSKRYQGQIQMWMQKRPEFVFHFYLIYCGRNIKSWVFGAETWDDRCRRWFEIQKLNNTFLYRTDIDNLTKWIKMIDTSDFPTRLNVVCQLCMMIFFTSIATSRLLNYRFFYASHTRRYIWGLSKQELAYNFRLT